jgi:hypothetical protein
MNLAERVFVQLLCCVWSPLNISRELVQILPATRGWILHARITEGIQEYKSYCVCKFVH